MADRKGPYQGAPKLRGPFVHSPENQERLHGGSPASSTSSQGKFPKGKGELSKEPQLKGKGKSDFEELQNWREWAMSEKGWDYFMMLKGADLRAREWRWTKEGGVVESKGESRWTKEEKGKGKRGVELRPRNNVDPEANITGNEPGLGNTPLGDRLVPGHGTITEGELKCLYIGSRSNSIYCLRCLSKTSKRPMAYGWGKSVQQAWEFVWDHVNGSNDKVHQENMYRQHHPDHVQYFNSGAIEVMCEEIETKNYPIQDFGNTGR